VLYFGFDLEDTFDIEVAFFADGAGRFGRDDSGVGEGFTGSNFDGEPGAKFILISPNATHFGPRVAGNQMVLLARGKRDVKLSILNGAPGNPRIQGVSPAEYRQTAVVCRTAI
jgi:hypothetical protein